MKKIIFALSLLMVTHFSLSCPTCVGTITDDAPPFFSQELYEAPQNSVAENTEVEKTNSTNN